MAVRSNAAAPLDDAGEDVQATVPAYLGPPSLALLLTEPVRGLVDYSALQLSAPWLMWAPRGRPHGVLVLPGVLVGDLSTAVLRTYLRALGYQVRGWELGRNDGPTRKVLNEMPRRLHALAQQTDGTVSLIGWSLGGVYARELARNFPKLVRRVITLGTPSALPDGELTHAAAVLRRRAHLHDVRVPSAEQMSRPIPVPSTSIYSRRDGVVPWRSCVAPVTALHENVEVRCAHLGFGFDPATYWAIADRLAQPEGSLTAFRAPAMLRALYGTPPAQGSGG